MFIDGTDIHDYITRSRTAGPQVRLNICYTALVERHVLVTFSVKGVTCIAIDLREP